MNQSGRIDIAGLSIGLHDVHAVLAELRTVYDQFGQRSEAFKGDERNPHLCHAGCSHCCKRGAIFVVTLAEAVEWSLAIETLPAGARSTCRRTAASLLQQQNTVFGDGESPADVPGQRDEAIFSSRISKLNASGPSCPLLIDELCSVYEGRPMLCRAYGFPVDAYAVESNRTIVFRSLCVLYEGMQLTDYLRAKDLKEQLATLSRRLAGGRDWGRFTSLEAILSRIYVQTDGTN